MSDVHESRARSDSTDVAFRKIFIGGLSYSTDEDKLRKYFKHYGSVQDAVVMKDPVSKRSRGFGFITFHDVSSVDHVLANEPHTIDARKVEAKRAVPRSEMNKETASPSFTVKSLSSIASTPTRTAVPAPAPKTPSSVSSLAAMGGVQHYDSKGALDPKINMDEYSFNKIFVGGLHYDTRDSEFRTYFERYGKVISAEVMFNRETHKSRGFGFIVFELEEGVERVCAEREHAINGKVVEVKRAIPRSKMNATQQPATPVKEPASGNSASATPGATSPPGASATGGAVRSRRAMSTGSAQAFIPPSSMLSGNSSTLTASTQKSSATPASAKKGVSSAVSGTPPIPPRALPASSSYAAALLLGSSHPHSHNNLAASDVHTSSGDSPPGGSLSFFQETSSAFDMRNRALSEPIAMNSEGSSALDGEIIPFDLGSLHSAVGVIQPSSNRSSRSNSLVGMPSNSLPNNLPWLSSPSTMPFEPNDLPPMTLLLPPAAAEISVGRRASTGSTSESLFTSNPFIGFGSHSSQRALSSEQDDRTTSLLQSSRGSASGNRARASSLDALGSMTVPDNWAALLQSHINFQESLGFAMSPVNPQQRQQHQLFSMSPDGNSSWNFGDGASVFGESSSYGHEDQGVSRILALPHLSPQQASPARKMVSPTANAGSGFGAQVQSTDFDNRPAGDWLAGSQTHG